MRLQEVLSKNKTTHQYSHIGEFCSQYIQESKQIPLFRNLSTMLPDITRVKLRHKKDAQSPINHVFAEAFAPKVRERSLFAKSTVSIKEDTEPFYIFPTNGYKYLYSLDVKDSTTEYNKLCETLYTSMDEEQATNVFSDMLRFTYHSDKLYQGIINESEILFYDIPAFYAVRVSSIAYPKLIDYIR